MQTSQYTLLLDEESQELIRRTQNTTSDEEMEALLRALVVKLQERCQLPEVQNRYEKLDQPNDFVGTYPIGADGYAISYDPVEEEEAFWNAWATYGYVVGKEVVSREQCAKTVTRIKSLLHSLSGNQFDLDRPETYGDVPVDQNGVPAISRGFFEVYHDDSLARIRQAVRVYLHHVLLWGRAELWTTFDRYGVKTADKKESKGLPIHVDQNPLVHSGFTTTQGVLALIDCPLKQGTFVAVPGSLNSFSDYASAVEKRDTNYRGEYVEAGWDPDLHNRLAANAQPIPIRAGDLVTWDSRTTHANSSNLLSTPRLVVYLSAGHAREDSVELKGERLAAFQSGEGKNVRDAMMHASMPPRCALYGMMEELRQPEDLTYLGRLLYGHESYPTTR